MRLRRIRRTEAGSILPLVLFFGVFCVILVLVVTAVTSLYLERSRLFALADGAALAGAESFALEDVQVSVDGTTLVLDPAEVDAAVRAYLEADPSGRGLGVTVEQAGSPDGRSAEVTLSTYWQPPVLTVFVPDGMRIEVTALARPVFIAGAPANAGTTEQPRMPVGG